MEFVDIIIVIVIAAIVGASVYAIYRSKKSGKKCIGCPDSGSCASGGCSGHCSGCNGACGHKH